MGTIIIGSSANRKGITVNPSVVLFNGSNVKSIMSGLTEIWSDAKALVPIMTSNTAPYGEVIYSGYDGRFVPYQAFNNTNNNYEDCWISALTEPTVQSPHYIGYKATTPIIVSKVRVSNRNTTGDGNTGTQNPPKDVILQGSNNGSDWENLVSYTNNKTEQSAVWEFDVPSNKKAYLYHRLLITSRHNTGWKDAYVSIGDLQFYGSQLVGLVPTMTDYSSGGYTVIYSDEAQFNPKGWYAWKVFNNNTTADTSTSVQSWSGSTPVDSYVGIHLPVRKSVKFFTIENYDYSNDDVQAIKEFVLQGSDDGEQWNDIQSYTNSSNVRKNVSYYNVDVPSTYYQYRILIKSVHQTVGIIRELQLYG